MTPLLAPVLLSGPHPHLESVTVGIFMTDRISLGVVLVHSAWIRALLRRASDARSATDARAIKTKPIPWGP